MTVVTGFGAAKSDVAKKAARTQSSAIRFMAGPILAHQSGEGEGIMKKALILAAMLVLITTAACVQKSETSVTTDSSGSVSSTHVESSTAPAIDTAATAQATAAVAEAGHDAADAARDAAHATGTALEKAGQKIQEKTDTTGTKP
jgi:Zn-dependent M28 family amino/carboxypeptidase